MNYETRCLSSFSEPTSSDNLLLPCAVYTYDDIFRSDAFRMRLQNVNAISADGIGDFLVG